MPGSKIYVRADDLELYLRRYSEKSSKLALTLMRTIVGEKNLIDMTPTGRGQYKCIPENVYNAVQGE